MQVNFRISKDTIRPDLRRKLAAMRNPQKPLEAAGQALVSLTNKAFEEASLRPSPWAPKKSGAAATLQQSRDMKQSIRITESSSKSVRVGSKTDYAAAHQLGSKKRGLPARPFFPFSQAGKPTEQAVRNINAALRRGIDAALK